MASEPGTADRGKSDDTGDSAARNGKAPTVNILTQYIKDLSFENPGAPGCLLQRTQGPVININVNVNADSRAKTDFEVALTLNVEAKQGKQVVFSVELVYAGVFRISGFPNEHILPVLFIECPRLLFPFARQVVAGASQGGGFPPLMIDPIDFASMFARRMAEEQAKAKTEVPSVTN